jgi:signal transduction histidine kinase
MKDLNQNLRLEVSEREKAQGALQRSQEELRQHRDKLQVLVDERTAELVRANEQLQRDMAERESLRAKLSHSEKLAAVGQLAAGLAHEINNPLGVILGFSQSILRRVPSDQPMFPHLQTIAREAERCKRLVLDLLVYSRAGAREREPYDLNRLVRSIQEEHRVASDIECVLELAPDLPLVLLDVNLFPQALDNLCRNAQDAMPKGGTLTLRTRIVRKDDRSYVELHIQDTGHGIPKDIQSRVFEPFFTTKEVGKGTGLGLSLVYEIVKDHGGFIEMESEEGKGTLFRLFLPIGAG